MTKRYGILIGALVLVYAAARMWRLADSCLWFDEIFGVHAAEHTWGEMFAFLAQDLIHPPLFYVLLKLWMAAGGDGVLWLRLFPFAVSLLAVVPFLLIGKELKLRRGTIAVALGFVAVNGALIKYAQEVRMYSLLFLLSLVSVWLFVRFFVKGKSFVALIIVNVLLVYTHYFGFLVVAAEVAAIVAMQRIKVRQMLLMTGIVTAAYVPWLAAVMRAATAGADVAQNIGWIDRPGLRAIVDFVCDLVEPFYFQASSAEPTTVVYISLPIILIAAAAMVNVAVELFAKRLGSEEDLRAVKLLGFFVVLPVAFALAASLVLPHSVWGSRHLIIVFGPAAFLIAVFVTSLPRRWMVSGAMAALGFFAVAAFAMRAASPAPEFVWCVWERIAEDAATRSGGEAAAIYTFEDLAAYHVWFAIRKRPEIAVYKIDGVAGNIEDTAYFLPRGFDGVGRVGIAEVDPEAARAGGRRVFAAFRNSNAPMFALAERGFRVADQKTFRAGGLETFLIVLD